MRSLLLVGALSVLAGPLSPPSLPGTSIALAAPARLGAPQNLGNPFLGKRNVYARNVWDMQSYDGKIYLGHGDSASNSGSTPVFSLDPHSGQFTNEFTTTSEQVDEFFPIGGELYTLDHDPVGANNGNLYCTDGGNWCIKNNISGAIHEYGLVEHNGALFVGGSSSKTSVWRRANGGQNWSGVLTSQIDSSAYKKLFGPDFEIWGARAFMLLPVKGELYAVRQGWISGNKAGTAGFFRYNQNSGQFDQSPVTGATLSGGLSTGNDEVRYKRLVKLDDGSVLTLMAQSINDHQWNPLALMHVSAIAPGGVAALALPGNAKPYDILRRGNLVYVCAFDASHGQNVVFSLPASNVGRAPTEVLRFDAPTFARSFEEAGGDFYFGLGCDQSPTPAQTGEIWKVAVDSNPNIPQKPNVPTPVPTAVPTPVPTAVPTPVPTAVPTPVPTAVPTPVPTAVPTPVPVPTVTSAPAPPVDPKTDPVEYGNGLAASYYKGMKLEGAAQLQRVEETVNFNASNGQFVFGSGYEQWSARYEGFIEAPITGKIKIWTRSDDGVRLFIGDDKAIDNWTNHAPAWNSTMIDVVRGQKLPIKLEYFQGAGGATLQLHWEWNGKRALVPAEYLWHSEVSPPPVAPTPLPIPTPPLLPATPGLAASYYRGTKLDGTALLQRVEETLNFAATDGLIVPEIGKSNWSARYEGFIEAPITGKIKIWTRSDDGVRLFIGDDKAIDNWTNHAPAWNSTMIDVVRGQKLPIKLEYFQGGGGATLQLHWEWDIQNRVIIPAESLSHRE